MIKSQQNKEQAILEAAEREFLTKGFAGARTTSIAKSAGVTHAMLHYYFRTKEHLFEQILDQKMRLMGESLLSAFGQPNLQLSDRLRNGLACHFDFIAANPDLPRFIVNEVFARPEQYKIMHQRIQQIANVLIINMQQEIDKAVAQNEMEWIDIRQLMLDILSLNIFPFIAYPIIEPIFSDITKDRNQFFEQRKAENIEIIMRRIKKS